MKHETEVSALRETNRHIGRVMRLHHRLCERRLSTLPIHRAQHMLLMRLSREGTLPSQKELASQMCVSPAAVAVALKRLEKDGYIARAASRKDLRVNAISITEKGLRVVKDSRIIFDEVDRAMYEGIDAKALDAFLKTLGDLEKNLEKILKEDTEGCVG